MGIHRNGWYFFTGNLKGLFQRAAKHTTVTDSKKGRCVEAKKGHYEFTQVLAITKPFISSGCFKKSYHNLSL